MHYFKENNNFPRFTGGKGGPTFFRGGGGGGRSNFFGGGGGGGGGGAIVIPMETYKTCDFPRGSGPPSPPPL